MLAIESLTKRFGSTLAVDGLSFRAEPGRVLGFLGPNGAGKTTTLRTLLGLTIPTSGTATVDGKDYRERRGPRAGSLRRPPYDGCVTEGWQSGRMRRS
jgi:ABC-2 type transport system ATP-binding protein